MKKILMTILLSPLLLNVVAQDTTITEISNTTQKINRHELSIGVANIFDRIFPFYYYYPNFDDYDYYLFVIPAYGLNYKFHFKKMALRIGTNFNYYSDKDVLTTSTYYDDFLIINSSIGIESKKSFGKGQIFYGLDLIVGYTESRTDREYTSSSTHSTSFGKSFGGSPLFGFKYQINEMISVSTETRFNVSKYETKFHSWSDFSSTSSTSEGLRIGISPIGLLSINVHL
ncbi:hypothetical protein JYT51_00755 [Candidatus Amoebophilus asiaticus]|nr:hypothetical protein [Candidatus Amoebophilus asiaticus]